MRNVLFIFVATTSIALTSICPAALAELQCDSKLTGNLTVSFKSSNLTAPAAQLAPTSIEQAYIKSVAKNIVPAAKRAENHPLFDLDPLNARKIDFIKERQALLYKMMAQSQFTLTQLREAPLFAAEIYIDGNYRPLGWVMILNSRVYKFDSNDINKVEKMKNIKIGYLSSNLHAVKLDDQYILNFFTDDNIVLQPKQMKDPSLLDKFAKNPKLDAARADLIKQFKPELEQLLLTTSFTLRDLAIGAAAKVKVPDTGAEAFLIVNPERNKTFYVSKTKGALDPENGNLFGTLEPKDTFGFSLGYERTLEFEDGRIAYLKNGRLRSSAQLEVRAPTALGINHKAAAAKTWFYGLYPKSIDELRAKNLISQDFKELATMLQVTHPVTEEAYLVIKTKNGYVAFGANLKNQWAYLKDIDNHLPLNWNLPNGAHLVIRESIGFQSSVVEEIHGAGMANDL